MMHPHLFNFDNLPWDEKRKIIHAVIKSEEFQEIIEGIREETKQFFLDAYCEQNKIHAAVIQEHTHFTPRIGGPQKCPG